jgi:hypothetical protein
LAGQSKARIRILKLATACIFSALVILAVGYLKYAQSGGWNDVVTHFRNESGGAVIFLCVATVLIFDYLSIVFFRFGIEQSSDELAIRSTYDGTGNPMPSELKMFFHPVLFIVFLLFI